MLGRKNMMGFGVFLGGRGGGLQVSHVAWHNGSTEPVQNLC